MHATQNSESVSVLTWSIAAYTCVCKWPFWCHSVFIEIRFLSLLLARIFTTLDRGFDGPLLANYSVSLVLNLAIISLALKLRRPAAKKSEWISYVLPWYISLIRIHFCYSQNFLFFLHLELSRPKKVRDIIASDSNGYIRTTGILKILIGCFGFGNLFNSGFFLIFIRR